MHRRPVLNALIDDYETITGIEALLDEVLRRAGKVSAYDLQERMTVTGVSDVDAVVRERVIAEAREALVKELKPAIDAAAFLKSRINIGVEEVRWAQARSGVWA